jgi:hypothetical protein
MNPACDGSLMRGIALPTTDSFSGTDFSLCGYALANGSQHRLMVRLRSPQEPVLQDDAKPASSEQAENQPRLEIKTRKQDLIFDVFKRPNPHAYTQTRRMARKRSISISSQPQWTQRLIDIPLLQAYHPPRPPLGIRTKATTVTATASCRNNLAAGCDPDGCP